MLVMGWAMARYGALLAGEVVTEDFLGYCAFIAAIVLAYGAIFIVALPHEFAWMSRAFLFVLALMASHVLAPRETLWMARLLYGPVRGTLRDQLRQLAWQVVRQPDSLSALAVVQGSVADLVREQGASATGGAPPGAEQSPRTGAGTSESASESQRTTAATAAPGEFRVAVESALRRLNDLPALTHHPLLDDLAPEAQQEHAGAQSGEAHHAGGNEPTPLERAAQLRDALVQAVARLRPPGARPMPGAHGGSGGWLHFLVLHEAYVEGRQNKEIMQRYYLSEGTFHRARRAAIDALALDLYRRRASALPATI
jgi:hypothetical protein